MLPIGPKDPMFVRVGPSLMWFQTQRLAFPLAVSGGLGQPTRPLLSGENELGMFLALNLEGHMWTNTDHTRGFGLSGFITEHRSAFETISGNGTQISRPYTDAVTGTPAELIAATPALGGSIASATTARLAGFDITRRHNIINNDMLQFDLFFGMRYYDLDESLMVYQSTPAGGQRVGFVPGNLPAGSVLSLMDRVYTRNQFYGGEVGGLFLFKHRLGYLSITPRVALGPTHQVTQISGETRLLNTDTRANGALLAAGANGDGNLGRFVTNRFTIATEIATRVGIRVTERMQVSLGYQFLYLNNTARPGAQLDPTINTRVIPTAQSFGTFSGPRAPNVTFDREGFYAHGALVGLEFTY